MTIANSSPKEILSEMQIIMYSIDSIQFFRIEFITQIIHIFRFEIVEGWLMKYLMSLTHSETLFEILVASIHGANILHF